jgi:hypothetical protein
MNALEEPAASTSRADSNGMRKLRYKQRQMKKGNLIIPWSLNWGFIYITQHVTGYGISCYYSVT